MTKRDLSSGNQHASSPLSAKANNGRRASHYQRQYHECTSHPLVNR
jgi:hypothetical protein